jgi:hypothetical protein
MNPTDPDSDPTDEALGRQLEEHLDSLGRPGHTTAPAARDSELGRLQPVVEQLFRLALGLSQPPTLSYVTPSASTVPPAQPSGHNAPPAPQGREAMPGGPLPAQVGKFRVVRALGHGGQAATLLALDPDLKRHVVLKLYHAARTPEEQEMVLREGQALARVRSPYVAQCYSAEREEGVPFLVMEYIPGRNLAEEHRAHPLSLARALDVVGRLAEGLAAVHACGLLHRDVKPGNVLIGEDGRPRLVDFGLAAPLASAELGQLSGTPTYMAPEQARGQAERIDARTDLYGLGAVLYELLTGRPPHQGGTRWDVLETARAGDVESVVKRAPGVPPAVAALCMRCLARDPADRFASADALAAAVHRVSLPARRRWPLWALAGAGVAAAVLAGILVLTFGGSGEGPGGDPRAASKDTKPGPDGPAKKLPPTEDPPPIEVAFGPGPAPAYLRGRKLRRDFPLEVRLVKCVEDPQTGEWHVKEGHFFTPDPKTGCCLLRVGEAFRVRLEVKQDVYVGVWDIHSNAIYELFPDLDQPQNFVRAGSRRDVPPEDAIQATAQAQGAEYVHMLATSRPFRKIKLPDFRSDPSSRIKKYETEEALEVMSTHLRDLALVSPRRPSAGTARPSQASEIIIPIRVVPAP